MASSTAYHMAFSNQVIPVSESSGGTGSGLVSGGETLHEGIETAVVMDISRWLSWQDLTGGRCQCQLGRRSF